MLSKSELILVSYKSKFRIKLTLEDSSSFAFDVKIKDDYDTFPHNNCRMLSHLLFEWFGDLKRIYQTFLVPPQYFYLIEEMIQAITFTIPSQLSINFFLNPILSAKNTPPSNVPIIDQTIRVLGKKNGFPLYKFAK